MSSQAEREAENLGAPFFGPPVRVIPAANDRVTRQIQRQLGDYNAVQQILEDDSKRLIGIDGVPASPAPLGSHGFFPSTAASRQQPKSEFKKPPSTHQHGSAGTNTRANNHYYPHSAPRGGFLKPADSKPPHGGRGGYPGQPVKHGGGSNDHRSNGGIVPPKGPPQGGGGNINSRVQQVARTLPRLNVNQPPGPGLRESSQLGSASAAEVDVMLKEMTEVMDMTPITGIATPRKEPESKFTFNPLKLPEYNTPQNRDYSKPRKYSFAYVL